MRLVYFVAALMMPPLAAAFVTYMALMVVMGRLLFGKWDWMTWKRW